MEKKLLKLTGFTAVILVILSLISILPASADINDKIEKDNERELEIGFPPPDFTVTDLEGVEFTLSDMAGEMPVVIDFWATWCGPCVGEIPVLVEFANMYEGQVQLIGISLDRPDNEQTVRDFMDEYEISYMIVYDEGNSALSDEYYVEGIPALFIIGEDGNLVNVHVGYSTESDLIGELEHELGL